MKILMTMYQIQDYGGIINHVENLTQGFREAGATVDIALLCPKKKIINVRSKRDDWQINPKGTGYRYNQARGWTGLPKIPYLNKITRDRFREKTLDYDAVIWHIPVPTLNKDNKGVSEWVDLYHPRAKHFGIIHDGNFPNLYPHLHHIKDLFSGLICVHEAAYYSTMRTGIDIPTKLIVNPFDLTEWQKDPEAYAPLNWDERSGFASAQIFKGWKHVDQLIRAIPRMQNNEKKIGGGAGIEYRYMTSYDKCKDKYKEPDGTRIWDNAIRYNMDYVGVIPTPTFYQYMKAAKLQIDPSWSVKYSQFGAHFNRTTVEAMICGAVPVATDLGMNRSGIFIAGTNYLQLEYDSQPANYAHSIDYWLSPDARAQWLDIRINNMEDIIPNFGFEKVINNYMKFISEGDLDSGFDLVSRKNIFHSHAGFGQFDENQNKIIDYEQKLKDNSKKNLLFFGIRDANI